MQAGQRGRYPEQAGREPTAAPGEEERTDRRQQELTHLLDTILDFFVPIHQDGHKFIAIGLLATLVGFFLCWRGGLGRGRALGVGEVKFTGQVLPTARRVTYTVDMKRVILRKLRMGIADATLAVDGRLIYSATDLKVGLFTSTDSF